MKIKVAFLDTDELYLKRLTSGLNIRYFDKLTIFSFSEIKSAEEVMASSKFDVVIASENFDLSRFEDICAVAFFAQSNDICSIKDFKAIGKYQRLEVIYKQILDLYSDLNKDIQIHIKSDSQTGSKVVGFFSAGGGSGSTSAASAYAMHLAGNGENVIYLNLEKNGCDLVFSGDGDFSFADVIYALKSKNSNLSLKLESCVKRDMSGVYFYSVCSNAFDFLELTAEEIIELVQTLKASNKYTYIVVDFAFDFSVLSFELLDLMYKYIVITAGNEISINKLKGIYNSIKLNDENSNLINLEKMYVLYNKFVNETSITADDLNVKVAGGIPYFTSASYSDIVKKLASLQLFANPLLK